MHGFPCYAPLWTYCCQFWITYRHIWRTYITSTAWCPIGHHFPLSQSLAFCLGLPINFMSPSWPAYVILYYVSHAYIIPCHVSICLCYYIWIIVTRDFCWMVLVWAVQHWACCLGQGLLFGLLFLLMYHVSWPKNRYYFKILYCCCSIWPLLDS